MGNPNDQGSSEPSNDEKYLRYGQALRAAVDDAIRPWLTTTLTERHDTALPDEVVIAIETAATAAWDNLTVLIEADVDRPLSGPLEQIRQAVSLLRPVLDAADFEAPARDPYDEQMQPDDVYALGPISFMDLGEAVQSAGITWGAAKAHLHASRRRGE